MAAPSKSGIAFGPYRLIRRLGAGGMAEVFLAKLEGPAGFQKNLVIKRILPHLVASERLTELFLNEARLAALVDHPNLVHVSGFGQIDDQYYLAMEYVDGFTLADFLGRAGSVSPGVACRVAVGLCEALHAIHTARDADGRALELVHRDVSSRNIMLTRDGAVKLLDFGIAVSRDDSESTGMGTRKYMAPEQHGVGPVDHRADLFGLGVVLGELLTGTTLGANASQRPTEVPAGLWSVLQDLLRADPERRPESAREVQTRLEVFLAGRGLEGTSVHLAEIMAALSPRAPRRALSRLTQLTRFTRVTNLSEVAPSARWMPLVLLGLLALSATGWAVWSYWPQPETEQPAEPAALVALKAPAPEVPATPIAETPTTTVSALPSVVEPPPVKRRAKKPRRKPALKTGKLTLNTEPWTKVYLGRRLLGMTPVVGVKLPSGKHRLRLENAELGLNKTIRVTIKPGKTTRLQRSL